MEKASTIQDYALLIGIVLLGSAILGGIFHFLRLGIYSAGATKIQAGVISVAAMAITAVFIYKKFF